MINLKKLLTENTVAAKPQLTESDHVHNGLHKVFGAGEPEVSLRRCENVGLGYIKNISEAIKIASTEAQKVAKIYGYRLDEAKGKFIKEDGEMSDFDRGEFENGRPPVSSKNDFSKLDAQSPEGALAKTTPEEQPHDETNMDDPEENAEVRIGNEILKFCDEIKHAKYAGMSSSINIPKIEQLARELLQMHGVKERPSTSMSGWDTLQLKNH